LPEGGALCVECLVGPCCRDDHPGQQVAPLLRSLWHGVVEDLANVERLGQRRLGVIHRRGERLGVLLAEFLYRKRQFVLAGAYRVVHLDDGRAGQVVERVEGDRRQRVGVGGVHPLRRGELGLTALALAVPPPQQQHQHRDGDDGQHHHGAHPVDPARGRRGGPLEAVGGGHRCACPVAAAQCGLDVVAAHGVNVHPARRRCGHKERVGAVGSGDGKDGILVL